MIRWMQREDYPAVYDILCYYIDHSTANLSWTYPDKQEYFEMLDELSRNYPVLVAEWQDEVIGFGFAHPFLGKEAYQFDAELTIYFRKGDHHHLASDMADVLEDICRQMGICRLISCTTADNEASMEYQKRKGFVPYGLLKDAGFKNGKWHDVAWLEKRISNTQTPKRIPLDDIRNSISF